MKKVLTLILALIMVASIVIIAGCQSTAASDSAGVTQSAAASASTAETTQSAAAPASSAAAETAAVPASGSKTGGFKIAYTSAYMGNSFRTQYEQAVRARLDEYKQKGVVSDYTYVACNNDLTQQLNQLNQLLQQNYDVIMVDPVSASSLTSVVQEAKQKGVKLIFGESMVAYEGIPDFMIDNTEYAKAEAYYLCEKLGGKGNIVSIHGLAGNPNAKTSEAAEKEIYAKYPGIKLLATGYGSWDDADAQKAMSTMLATYGDQLNAVFSEDGMAYGIANAFQNAGKSLVPMGGDYFDQFINYWYEHKDTLSSITVPASPYGIGRAVVDACVYTAAGYTPKELNPNPIDPSIKNWAILQSPYVILNKDEMNPSWLKEFPDTKAMSIDDAYKLMQGKPNTAAIELYDDDSYIASLFGLDKNPWLS